MQALSPECLRKITQISVTIWFFSGAGWWNCESLERTLSGSRVQENRRKGLMRGTGG